jgi:tight adherence protein B
VFDSLILTKLAGLLKAGVSLEQSLEEIKEISTESLGLKYLLAVARDSGSAVASEIEYVAELFQSRERALQRIEIAHASPKATARLMLFLPVLILVMAQFMGWGVLDSLTQKPIVLLSMALGAGLLLLSKIISSSFLKRAKPTETFVGFYLLGVSLEVSGGAHLVQAQRRAEILYQDIFQRSPAAAELQIMEQVARLVEQKGARATNLLRKQAKSLQDDEHLATEVKIEKLTIRLMLPLGLGVLPAFVFLAIVPLMATTLGSN